MDLSFPEELLGTSLLIPKGLKNEHSSLPCPPTLPLKSNDSMDPALLLPSKRPALDNMCPAPRFDSRAATAPELLQSAPSSNHNSNIKEPTHSLPCTIQLELEKERKLYALHMDESAKSFDRIVNLVAQLAEALKNQCDKLPLETKILKGPSERQVCTVSNQITLPENPETHQATNDSIRDLAVTVTGNFFPQIPCCLLFRAKSEYDDLMITTTVDGFIQYSSVQSKSILRNDFLPSLLKRNCHATTICAADSLDGFLLSVVENSSNRNKYSITYLPYEPNEDNNAVTLSPGSLSHTGTINTLSPYLMPSSSAEGGFQFLGGGSGCCVFLWEINKELQGSSTKLIHKSHSSCVQTTTQSLTDPQVILSGGADCQLVGWSLKESRITLQHIFDSKIADLRTNKHHPNTLLTTFCSKSHQLLLLDQRAPLDQNLHALGYDDRSIINSRMKPAWSDCGNLIAFGTGTPTTLKPAVNIWDIRYFRFNGPPMYSVEFQGKKKFTSCGFWPGGNLLVALANDESANFIDFGI